MRIRARLRALYHGASPTAVRFRLAVIVIDFAIISFFIAAPLLHGWAYYALDGLIALLLTVDLAARALAQPRIADWLKRPLVWVDIFILATLLFPTILYNFGFLRVLRLWTLLNSDFFWRTIGRRYDDTRVEEVVKSGSALLAFVFVVTGFVYATYVGRHEGIAGRHDVRPSGGNDIRPLKRAHQVRQPVGVDSDIRVRVRDDLTTGVGCADVPRRREAVLPGIDHTHVRVLPRNLTGRVGRSVVDDDRLVPRIPQRA